MDLKLTQLNIQGFKSFGKEQNIRFGDITIFIGANGSGKSNLMSFFEMLGWMMDKKLEHYVAVNGGSSFFTHLSNAESVKAKLDFYDDINTNSYEIILTPTSQNYFVVSRENILEKPQHESYEEFVPVADWNKNNNSQKEVGLLDYTDLNIHDYNDSVNARKLLNNLKKIKFFQFHNTSSNAKIRQEGYVNNTGYLMSNGGNLAAFFYGLQQRPEFKKYYDRIIRNIKLAYPSFDNFSLAPNPFYPDNVRLDWRDEFLSPDYRFSPQQLSDGTLRFMALSALLLQPPETIPKVIVIDEPELGLHPSAISLLANMIYTAAPYSQIVLATQSAELLDYFEPEHIRVVERKGSNSIVTEPDKEGLKSWLEEYSLGQIWEKNIIGGRP